MKRPRQITLELTNACNADCAICLHRKSAREIVHMDIDLVKKIIKEIKENDFDLVTPIGLCGIGEPSLHPHFKEIINIFYDSEMPFGVGTNGQTLDKYIELLINKKVNEFVVSIDAVTNKTHRKVRGSKLNFYKIVDNTIQFFKRMEKEKDWTDPIYVQFIVSKLNHLETIPFIKYWLPFVQKIPSAKIFIKEACPFPTIDYSIYYPSPKVPELEEYREDTDNLQICTFEEPINFKKDCSLFDTFVQIQSNGAYSPCCMNSEDFYGIGNIHDKTILDCFHSHKMDKYRKLREESKIDKIPFCNQCV